MRDYSGKMVEHDEAYLKVLISNDKADLGTAPAGLV
jgi:hypothetical protein